MIYNEKAAPLKRELPIFYSVYSITSSKRVNVIRSLSL